MSTPPLTPIIADSYRYCEQIAKARAKNFYYSFLLLEPEKRSAMCAIYAFMRQCDDLSDDEEARTSGLSKLHIASWRVELDHALRGKTVSDPIWPAFCDAVERFNIPHRYFFEMIEGVMSDIQPQRIVTFDDLYRYCYKVASVVGLTIIHIFGYESVKALFLAEKCGIAFQLTNILRDVREDAGMGRIYLPLEDLKKFEVTDGQLKYGFEDDGFRDMMRFEAARARRYYDDSADLLHLVDRRSRRSLWALRAIYQMLLGKIEHQRYAVLSHRIAVSKPAKIALLMAAFLR